MARLTYLKAPSKIVMSTYTGRRSPTGAAESPLTHKIQIDGMDLQEVIEFLIDEIDSLNKRVKSLETKRS